MQLYHGTSVENHETILEEGLRGGDNTCGGNRGVWDTPLLFLSDSYEVAQKYGEVLIIDLPDDFYLPERINDGLGDPCYVLEGEGILVPAEYISSPFVDHDNGFCDDCEYCI